MNTTVAIALVVAFTGVVVVAIDAIKSFLLKKEQIKADALVRVEEVKARNQLELEKLLRQDQVQAPKAGSADSILEGDTRAVREKVDA